MSGVKVLLVDDEIGFTAGLKRVLSSRGFDVKETGDGLKALSMIAGEHFDIVVLDIKMPGTDGFHVLSEITRSSPDIRVILLTGHYSSNEEESTLKKGAYAYLLKPYPVLGLVDIIFAAAQNGDACPFVPSSNKDST
jgi:DNA-binding NtrC family response regulator